MSAKILGAGLLSLVAFKALSRHHGMAGGYGPRSGFGPQGRPGFGPGGFGPRGRRGFGPMGADSSDPRRQWIREFHRSLHEADEAEAAATTAGTASGTDGDAPSTTNETTAG